MFKNERRLLVSCILVISIILGTAAANADEEVNMSLDKSLEGIKFGVLSYIDYSAGQSPLAGDDEESYNRFALTRGYFTVKKTMNDWMGFRMTSDLKQETKAEGAKLNESYVVRIKYFYAELKPNDFGVFTDMKSEVGLGHMPWLDFEEHTMDPYRCQGVMPVERAHIFNSADVGLSLRGNFGGKLEDAKEKLGNAHYAGKYGSWHIGVYNGGGYHAVEENQNKLFEGRLTLRPLPNKAPGLQFSYLYITGEGNLEADHEFEIDDDYFPGLILEDIPDYNVNLYMVSFQHPIFIATYQAFITDGNAGGDYLQPDGDALATEGWSAFVNVKLPGTDGKVNLFGRYDWFDIDPDDEWADETVFEITIVGLAFDLHKNNLLLFAWETTEYEEDSGAKGKLPVMGNDLGEDEKFQAVWQIKL
jgi:hypothetical protein